jgi:endonuclease I
VSEICSLPKGAVVTYRAIRTLTGGLAMLLLAACVLPAPAPPSLLPVAATQQQARPAPADYYKNAEGLSGTALLKALMQRVSGQASLNYGDARDAMFADVDDPTGTDTILSVYTGKKATGVTDRQSADGQGFATEHTWPQSLGAGNGDAKSDLHHLFPVDTAANSARGNHPFGIVVTPLQVLPAPGAIGQTSRLGTDSQGVTVFEPWDRHKGDVARALMYFYVRYALPDKGPGPLSVRNFRQECRLLQQWHRQDPVDATEARRNDRIFAVQHNRNPFIDRPDFVQRAGAAFETSLPAVGG